MSTIYIYTMSHSSQYILQPNPSTHGNRADMVEKSSVPIITLTTYDLPIQLKNGSFLHWLEQPSPFIEFISSHSSPLELKQQEALLRKHSNPHCQTDKCRIRNKDIFLKMPHCTSVCMHFSTMCIWIMWECVHVTSVCVHPHSSVPPVRAPEVERAHSHSGRRWFGPGRCTQHVATHSCTERVKKKKTHNKST